MNEFDMLQYGETIAAGKAVRVSLLEYFALVSGVGLQLRVIGRGGRAMDLPINFVFGDGHAHLGPVDIVNPTGAPVTFKLITSTVDFRASALAGTQSMSIDAVTVTVPTTAVVRGTDAAGVAPTVAPVLVGGTDGALARSLKLDTSGRPIVVGAAATGAAVAGNPVLAGGSDGVNAQPLAVTTAGKLRMTVEPKAAAACSVYRLRSAATTNGTSVKGAAGVLHYFTISTTAALALKFYDLAAGPVVGTDIPCWSMKLAANNLYTFETAMGFPFANGIAFAITGGEADTDVAAIAAGAAHLMLGYT